MENGVVTATAMADVQHASKIQAVTLAGETKETTNMSVL